MNIFHLLRGRWRRNWFHSLNMQHLIYEVSVFLQIRKAVGLLLTYFDSRLKYLVILVKIRENVGLADVESWNEKSNCHWSIAAIFRLVQESSTNLGMVTILIWMPAEGYTLTVLQLFCQLEVRITASVSYKLSTCLIVLVVFFSWIRHALKRDTLSMTKPYEIV